MTWHPLRTALLALGLAICGATSAAAATVSVEDGTLVLRATPGVDDTILVRGDDAGALVRLGADAIPDFPAGICQRPWWGPDDEVDCAPQPGGIRIEAGDGNDSVGTDATVPGNPLITVLGGAGHDKIGMYSLQGRAHLDGGPGNDELTGTTTAAGDVLLGGPGDDVLDGRSGPDELRGGEGDDELQGDNYETPSADLLDGGPGTDRIERDWYVAQGREQPFVTVTLDGKANDGRPGEGDNVLSVEKIKLTYPASLTAARDRVDFEIFNTSIGSSRLTGSPGPDRLRTYDAADTIVAGAGDDWIEAGLGNDTITPGPGRDTVNADAGPGSCNFLVCRIGPGNDTIHARDGQADSIDCGGANDVAYVDAKDRVVNCETVRRGPARKKQRKRGKARAVAAQAAPAATTLTPQRPRCVQLPGGGKRLCAKRKVGDRWSKGWWFKPAEYRVIDASIFAHTTLRVPHDGFKSFAGEGYVTAKAKAGFHGTLKLPAQRSGPAVSVLRGTPVEGRAVSQGAWSTESGDFSCSVSTKVGRPLAPNALTGVVAASPATKTISIQWAVTTAPFRCPQQGQIANPTLPEIPSAALTTRYPASAFRGAELLKLPIKTTWTRTSGSEQSTVTLTLRGSITLQRVDHRIGG